MNDILKNWVVKLHEKKVKYLLDLIKPMLGESKKILDLGCGSGEVSKALLDSGYLVTSVDVVDKVKVEGVKVLVYDGVNIPFRDKEFDVVLLITVLHHVKDHDKLLIEASRAAKKVIVVEDVYENWWDKVNIWFWDSVLNLEFFGHPHQNRDDQDWKKVFVDLKFDLLAESSGKIREFVYEFKQKAYLIQRRSDTTK